MLSLGSCILDDNEMEHAPITCKRKEDKTSMIVMKLIKIKYSLVQPLIHVLFVNSILKNNGNYGVLYIYANGTSFDRFITEL